MTEINKEALLKLYPEYKIVHGPYMQSYDFRKILIFYESSSKKRTISLAKALMEVKLGRRLLKHEIVDHIDNASGNDDIDNLQILSIGDNTRKSSKSSPMAILICIMCNKQFERELRTEKRRQRLGRFGPFC